MICAGFQPHFRSILRAALSLLTIVGMLGVLSGCRMRLPGLHDVEVEYDTPPAIAAKGLDPQVQVELRLLRSRVPATVLPNGPHSVAVIVDAELTDALDHALSWQGGLRIYRLDKEHGLPPNDPTDLIRAADTTEDATHRLLYDPFSMPANVVVAEKKPLHDFGGDKADAEGKDLVIRPRNAAPITALAKELGDEVVAFTRGAYIIHQGRLRDCFTEHYGDDDKPALHISRGTDILAYSRARREARLLGTPAMTASIKEVKREPLPTNLRLASGCILFPLFAGFLWLLFVRRFDRARPEPWWLMLATAVLGGLSGELAGYTEHYMRLATPYLDPDVMSLDLSPKAYPITLIVFTVAVGMVEEGAKLLATWSLAMHRREFDEPVDGILYAAAAGIGFAVDENIGYFASYRLEGGLVATRSLDCIAAHTMMAAIWGYALGKRLVVRRDRTKKKPSVIPLFLLTSLIHGAMDCSLQYHIPYAAIFVMLVLTTFFLILLRRALRWGSVDEIGGEAPHSTSRLLFRTGGGVPLTAAVFGVYIVATLLIFVGRVVDADDRRVSFPLLTLTTVLLIMLAVTAYGVARTLPLDVVIDDLGVTFAGALRRWTGIEGASRIGKDALLLHSRDGNLLIGSASAGSIESIESNIRDRLRDKTS